MDNLETIVNILTDNAPKFLKKHPIDMSMFSEKDIPKIYSAAADKTLKKGDFDSAGGYLCLGKHWGKLLELGTSFFHGKDEKEIMAGKKFLKVLLYYNQSLPQNTAIELAEHILEHDEKWVYQDAAAALAAGNATDRAEQIAYKFFGKGNFENGALFLTVAGKKLTSEEVNLFAGEALKHRKYEDGFQFYKMQSLSLPNDRAKIIAYESIGTELFEEIIEYMDQTRTPFSKKEFKELGDAIFEAGHHEEALEIYKRASKEFSPREYWMKGERILEEARSIESRRDSFSPREVWPTVKDAFSYLSEKDVKEARLRMAKYADSLLGQPDFAKICSNAEEFGKIYEMIKMPMPVNEALNAAYLFEKKKRYGDAAKFYAAAGRRDEARRMGNLALSVDNDWQKRYETIAALKAANYPHDQKVIKFIEQNFD